MHLLHGLGNCSNMASHIFFTIFPKYSNIIPKILIHMLVAKIFTANNSFTYQHSEENESGKFGMGNANYPSFLTSGRLLKSGTVLMIFENLFQEMQAFPLSYFRDTCRVERARNGGCEDSQAQ